MKLLMILGVIVLAAIGLKSAIEDINDALNDRKDNKNGRKRK